MKYKISYEYDGGKGSIELNDVPKNEIQGLVDKLRLEDCRNVTIQEYEETDPCDRCNRQICYGCEHSN